ncbi:MULTISPECIES: ABC transporter permease [Bizionia]|uniref:ABC transporter permease n=1 Tax=Bizionia algoritergicola TaxID=291187 RepID=A0A5D0R395_9FLAO|nr:MULTISPECIES: ABC transporter permease [Bizionia]OBX24380.1 ABC transporter permease [Bizionia sp. APA-3]TYB75301.1 ABC transporter permease [Bizionia algoritergicola]
MSLSHLDIAKFLPHRPPFLMVDHVLSIDDEHVSTSFTIKPDCIFNENGVFNEAGLVENAAQTCSSIVGKSFFNEDDIEGKGTKLIGFISAIKKVTVMSCPKVGSKIVTSATLKSRFDTDEYSICTISCIITLEHIELLSCELNLVIQELK